MSYSPGKLRHVITFQQQKRGQDSFGAPFNTWEDVFTHVPACVEHLSAKDLIASSETHFRTTARIIINYRPGIDPAMRIIHRDEIYHINGIIPDLVSGLNYLTIPVTKGMES